MTNKELIEKYSDPDRILEQFERGVADAIEEHRKAGIPIVGLRNGKIVWEQAPDPKPAEPVRKVRKVG